MKSSKLHEDTCIGLGCISIGRLSASCGKYDPMCIINDNIPTTDAKEVFTSDGSIPYPWFEVKLRLPAKIIGLVFYHNLQLEPWTDVQIRTGLTSTSAADGSSPSGLLMDLDLIVTYKGPSVTNTASYVSFPEPVVAQYILVQANWNVAKKFTLSEMRVIESKYL